MTAEFELTNDAFERAIQIIRASNPPADGFRCVMTRFRTPQPVRRWSRPRSKAIAGLALLAASVLAAFLTIRFNKPAAPQADHDLEQAVVNSERRGANHPPAPESTGHFAGVTAVPRMAVAQRAPIIVAGGGAAPLDLGAKLSPAARASDRLQVWDWNSSSTSTLIKVETLTPFAVTPDGKSLLLFDGQSFSLSTGAASQLPWWQEIVGENGVAGLHFSRDGNVLGVFTSKGFEVGAIQFVEFTTGRPLGRVEGLWPAMSQVAFSSDATQAALYGADRRIRLVDVGSGRELRAFDTGFSNSLVAIAMSDQLLAGCYRGVVKVWDLTTGVVRWHLDSRQDYGLTDVRALAFSPDGQRLAGGGSQNLLIWSMDDGSRRHMFGTESGGAMQLQYSSDGRTLTTVHSFTVRRAAPGAGPADDNSPPAEDVYGPTVQSWKMEAAPNLQPAD